MITMSCVIKEYPCNIKFYNNYSIIETFFQPLSDIVIVLDFEMRLWYVFVLERSVIHYDNA